MAATTAGPGTALASWRDGPAKDAILEFVANAEAVPVEERVAVFDNDGTLWCEKPMPIQLDFILRRFVDMAEADPSLARAPAVEGRLRARHAWLGKLMEEHYAGDDSNVRVLAGGILAAYDGMSVEEFEARSDRFLRETRHPTLGRGYLECVYAPMLELLDHLAANHFTNYIVSGGAATSCGRSARRCTDPAPARDRQQRRAELHERRPRRTITHTGGAGLPRRRPEKPVRIWSRTGRRPLLAAGNSNGDVPMLDFTRHDDKPSLRLLVLHDDRSGSSPTPAGPSRRSSGRRPRAGPSSASRTTGSPSSDGAAEPVPHVHVHAPHELSETGQSGPGADRAERVLELLAILLLSLTTLATAWSGYQAARWSGEQSQSFARASTMRIKAQAQIDARRAAAHRRSRAVQQLARRARGRRPASSPRSTAGASGRTSCRRSTPGSPSGRSPAAPRSRDRCTPRSTACPRRPAPRRWTPGGRVVPRGHHREDERRPLTSSRRCSSRRCCSSPASRCGWHGGRCATSCSGMAGALLLAGVIYVLTLPVA
jgi:hypothetical protein